MSRGETRSCCAVARARCALLLSLVTLVACSSPPAGRRQVLPPAVATVGSRERVQLLRAREDALRSSFSPLTQPPWIDVSGADPYRIAKRGSRPGFVGILRGSRALVTLDADLRELGRVSLPETPTALCVAGENQAWVASRYGHHLRGFVLDADQPVASAEQELPVAGVADLACGDAGVVYVLPADGSSLLTLDQSGHVLGRLPALRGPLRLLKRGRFLLESSLFERTLRVFELGPRGVPSREVARIQHDGTLWAFDAAEQGRSLLIAVAGVEDKPLVRAHGEFENIDSFVWLYRFDSALSQLATLDVGDSGLVVPKAVHLSVSPTNLVLTALAAGSGRMLRATWPAASRAAPGLETFPLPPGMSDAVFAPDGAIAYADPLFDAWIKFDQQGAHVTRVDSARRPEPDVRLGEALFFTELMAPDNPSAGTHSRFSCETCHLDGGVDGRVHYTGRSNISVVTKPLFGLANNRPHFSRAMDPDLSSVCHNEFRVAGAGSGESPWFTLETARFPWLHELGIDRAQLGPLELREALLKFLYAFSHAPNVMTAERSHFSQLEAAGAHAFERHCESCHAARFLSDDSSSRVPFEAWAGLIFSRNAPLVWARADYAQTGVLPYVHERGTRITSLRRLALKPRYFTNGSAADLADVLARFREGPEGAFHQAPPDAAAVSRLTQLTPDTQRALLEFLRLL